MSCAVAHILHYPELPYALYPCLFKLWWGLWLPSLFICYHVGFD